MEESPTGSRHAHGPPTSGAVIDVPVARPHDETGPNPDFVPDDQRFEQIRATHTSTLSQRQDSGEHHRTGMPDDLPVSIIDIESVRHESVHKSGARCGDAKTRAKNRRLRRPR